MRILILGASGLTGKEVMKELWKDNKVFGTYFHQKEEYNSLDNMFYLDIEDYNTLKDILDKTAPDIIISAIRGNFEKQLQLHKIAALYIKNKEKGKFIYLSSANAFDNSVEAPHYENDVPAAESDYGIFKIDCEKLLTDMLHERAAIIRVPFIWAKQAPRFLKILQEISEGKPVKCYNNLYCNHTTDLQIAQVVRYIIDNSLYGYFHIGSTDVCLYRDFIERLLCKLNYSNGIELDTKPEAKYYMAMLSERSDLGKTLNITSNDVIDYLTS